LAKSLDRYGSLKAHPANK